MEYLDAIARKYEVNKTTTEHYEESFIDCWTTRITLELGKHCVKEYNFVPCESEGKFETQEECMESIHKNIH